MSEKVYFMGKDLLDERPPEGTYKGFVTMDVSALELLKFFNCALEMYDFLMYLRESDNFVDAFKASYACHAFSIVLKDSGLTSTFEHFRSCCKEARKNGKES